MLQQLLENGLSRKHSWLVGRIGVNVMTSNRTEDAKTIAAEISRNSLEGVE